MTDDMEDNSAEAENAPMTKDDLVKLGAKWLDKIAQAEKREERWMKSAKEAQKAYLADDDHATFGEVPEFNILHSNVETIVPSIYNSTPVPDIRPRHNNPDPVAKFVSELYERCIAVSIDDNRLDAEVEKVAQDAFMAGRGILRVKFDADVTEQPESEDEYGGMIPAQTIIAKERVEFEVVPFEDYRQGPAKRWKNVPWVAYRHYLSHEDLEAIQDPEIKAAFPETDENKEETEEDTPVWEIWCRSSGRVYFIAGDSGKVISIKDDPLNLQGFFPQAEPIQPISATNSLTPVCPFEIYKTLAKELDTATRRINAIMKGLKVRGIIAGDASIMEALSQVGDNELVPIANLENMAATGGLNNAVMWWPVEQAIKVLQQLYTQRESTKQAIYEITGISDIIRGQSSSAETATAQNIKTQWGALRIKKMQRAIERQIRDVFVICADIISQHFSPETMQKMSGMQIPPEAMQLLQKPLDSYRIDIESDSTVRADLTRGRQEMSEFLNATGSYFSTMAPLIQQAPESAGEFIEIFGTFARQFNLGKQAEDALDRLIQQAKEAAKQPKPNPQAEAMQAEQQAKAQEMQMKAQEGQIAQQVKAAELRLKEQEIQAKAQEAQGRLQIDAAGLDIEREKLAIDREKLAIEREKLAIDRENIALEAARIRADAMQPIIQGM